VSKRLILVHGINNENNTPGDIEAAWTGALSGAWTRSGLPGRPAEVTAVFYADRLAELSRPPVGAVRQGPSAAVPQTEFQLYEAYRRGLRISEGEVEAAAREAGVSSEIIEQGGPHQGWIIGIARALERVVPTKGRYVIDLFLRQAGVYLSNPGVRTIIKKIVRDQMALDDRPTVVVAHSLGTVVAYELLLEAAQSGRHVDLFCTVGSPLAVDIFSNYVGTRDRMPAPPIGGWVNGGHRDDLVTLGKLLDKPAMGFAGITNTHDIPNSGEDKHSVTAYLAAPRIALEIHKALTP
jgi:hypothetical protein